MKNIVNTSRVRTIAMTVLSLSMLAGVAAFAGQDSQNRYTLKAPDGIAFSEFKGYERWQDVAVSRTEKSIKAILANPS